jgi:epoxyqueuosine reductase
VVDPERCLPSLSTRLAPWPPEAHAAWGFRLYGCQSCQDACPHNRGLRFQTATKRGEIGPSVPLGRLLSGGEEGVREMFRGTALGMAWIRPAALLRNGLLAAGHRGDRHPAVREAVRARRQDPVGAVRAAAAWAEARLGRG